MSRAFDRLGNFALILERVSGDAPRKNFSLLIDEVEQKLRLFIINVADVVFLEAAIFFRPLDHLLRREVLDVFI